MRTHAEWLDDFRKLGNHFKEFRDSSMSVETFLSSIDAIVKNDKKDSSYFDKLLTFYYGLKGTDTKYKRNQINHEWSHVVLAKSILSDLEIHKELKVMYCIERLEFPGPYGSAFGVGPSVSFPNLFDLLSYSKPKMIIFHDRMLSDHDIEMSEADKLHRGI